MTDIPLPPSNTDIYSYGFDKSLNKDVATPPDANSNIVTQIRNALLQAGIDVNSVSQTSSGNFERNDFHWFTLFESIDGYGKAGTPVINGDHVAIPTTINVNDTCELQKVIRPSQNFTWNKNRKIRCAVSIISTVNQQIAVTTGPMTNITDIQQHIGFKIAPNALYATVGNGINETNLNLNFALNGSVYYNLEVQYIAGKSATFYVNNVKMGVITTGLPSGYSGADLALEVWIRNMGGGASREIDIGSWDFWQAN